MESHSSHLFPSVLYVDLRGAPTRRRSFGLLPTRAPRRLGRPDDMQRKRSKFLNGCLSDLIARAYEIHELYAKASIHACWKAMEEKKGGGMRKGKKIDRKTVIDGKRKAITKSLPAKLKTHKNRSTKWSALSTIYGWSIPMRGRGWCGERG